MSRRLEKMEGKVVKVIFEKPKGTCDVRAMVLVEPEIDPYETDWGTLEEEYVTREGASLCYHSGVQQHFHGHGTSWVKPNKYSVVRNTEGHSQKVHVVPQRWIP